MGTCPRCGEEVLTGADTCGACGAALLPGQQLRWYLVSAATLATIIIAAALFHYYLEGRVVRSPMEFVPGSARAVVVLDLRPQSPAGRQVFRTWSAADRRALAARAFELSQHLVDWTGLRLDLRKHAAQWFGGEILLTSIGGPDSRSFTPRSVVLIARVTSLRHARRDLHRAVEELAREGGWERRTLMPGGRTITVWGPAGGDSELAYATLDGCVLIGASSELVELCLRTPADPSARLAGTDRFRGIRDRLPKDALVWGYLDADDLLEASRDALPLLRQGWAGVVRRYLASRSAGPMPARVGAGGGSIAAAITPDKHGLRLHASYLAARTEARPVTAGESADLQRLVPRNAAAFAYVRDLPGLLALVTGNDNTSPASKARALSGFLGIPGSLLQPERLPESLLVTVLPRTGSSRAAVAAAFAGGSSRQTRESLAKLAPVLRSAEVSGAQVMATDEEGVEEVEAAAKDPARRLQFETGGNAALRVWARPAALSAELARLEELSLLVEHSRAGADLQLSVRAEPRYLLGGR